MTPPEPTAEARAVADAAAIACDKRAGRSGSFEPPCMLCIALALDAFRAQGVEQAEKERDEWALLREADGEYLRLNQRIASLEAELARVREERDRLDAKVTDLLEDTLPHCSGCGVVLNCTGSHREHEFAWHQRAVAARREALLAAAEWHEKEAHRLRQGAFKERPTDDVALDRARIHKESAAHFRRLAEGNPSPKVGA